MLSDFRFAARALRRSPGFTAVSLVVLTLGIGATTAIYSIVDAVALKGMPFDRARDLMIVAETTLSTGRIGGGFVAAPNFMDWRSQQTSFEDLAAFQSTGLPVYDPGKEPESLRGMMVSASLFPMLRVQPVRGQLFSSANEVRGRHRVALISTRLWQHRFGSDPAIVGKTFVVGDPVAAAAGRGNNGLWQIVGVMPEGFDFPVGRPLPIDVWVPWVPPADEYPRGDGSSRNYNAQVLGRLKPGVTREQAYAQMAQITTNLKALYPNWFRDNRWVSVTPLHESVVGQARGWMFLLLGSVAFVLLIACVNVANLMLARATARSRDVSVRAALGASRWQLARVLLAESLILSAAGTLLGLAVAYGGIGLLRSSLPGTVPRLADAGLDLRVLGASALAAIVTGLIFGLLPALKFSRPRMAAALAGGRSGEAGQARERARSILLIAEVALAVMLLIGAGLFVSSFVKLVRVDLGTSINGILTMRVSPRLALTGDRIAADQTRAGQQIEEVFTRLKTLPGVTDVAFMVNGSTPLTGGYSRTVFEIPGVKKWDQPDDIPDTKSISSGYFKLLDIPLLKGREFSDADRADGAPLVVIINDVAEQRFFNGANPIGQMVKVNGDREIVGVVRAVRVGGPEADLRPEIFTPVSRTQGFGATMFLKTSVPPEAIAASVRQVVRDVLPTVIVPQPETMETMYGKLIAQRRFNMIVLALFGGLAIVIAAVGIYGVMTYLVTQRTQEIGIRMALGAKPAQVVQMVLSRAAVLMLTGTALGVIGGWMLSKYVQSFLFKVEPHDVIVYAGAAAILLAAGLLAAFVPARRASRIDPMEVLR
jgi:putative ABC transport system permease protein